MATMGSIIKFDNIDNIYFPLEIMHRKQEIKRDLTIYREGRGEYGKGDRGRGSR